MSASLFLCLLAFPCAEPTPRAAAVHSTSEDPAIDAKIAAAGSDVAKLLELASACMTDKKADDAKKVYKRILELDADNETAHKALNHQFYDKRWFESFAELSKFKREEAAKMKDKGLARFKDEWVPVGDLPFLGMGWTKDAKGVWVNPVEVARAQQIEEWKAANYQFRADDNSWIAPEDFEKWKALQWKCGDQWLDTAAANEYHSKLGQWWQLAGEHFTIWTTCEWDAGNLARWYADKTQPELVRLFGVVATGKPHVIVLNGLDQYNQVSGGNPPVIPESEGISSLHGAYFADSYFDPAAKPPQFLGAGVSYWDRKDPKVGAWGPFWVRWAAAQSYVEAIDPSWAAVGERIAGGASSDPQASSVAFWSEKKIPRWLRYGAASYVERFMKNPEAAQGADPWDLRTFAFAEVKKTGGLQKLEEVFAFKLDIQKPEESSRLYHEAGLVVAFLLDGAEKNKGLAAKHEAFKEALKSGSKQEATEAAEALQKELEKNEAAIKKFAGL